MNKKTKKKFTLKKGRVGLSKFSKQGKKFKTLKKWQKLKKNEYFFTNFFKLKHNKDKQEPKYKMQSGGAIRYNEQFIDLMEKLSSIMLKQGEPFRARAYQKAQETLMSYPEDILSVEQLKGKPGIGATILEKLNEYVNTGTLKILEREKNNPVNILGEIYGVGPKKAKELVEKGITTIEQLREHPEVLNDVQKNGLDAFITANPRVVLPQNHFPEFVCLYLKDDHLKLLNITKKDFADKLTDVDEKDEIITKNRFYFMFNSSKNILTLYTSSYSEPDNISIHLTTEQSERLNRFIILNPFVKEGQDEGQVYINLLKTAINPIVPISLFSDKANEKQKQRIEEADKLYFKLKGTTLTLMGGWQCQPIYDISDRILFPLISLFKRPTGSIKEISKYLLRPKKV